ncbi:MAG: RNA polymerase sigma factor [Luteimonas sp.]|nr:RNA polymerase sigma factor [Luteimonas sp.]
MPQALRQDRIAPGAPSPAPRRLSPVAAGVGRVAVKLDGVNTDARDIAGSASTAASAAAGDAVAPATLEGFLAGVGARAFRFAEAGLRHREDAMDAVQEAMMKMLAYRERPADEWTPLFWSILRSRIIDTQRRRMFRLGWLGNSGPGGEDASLDWADDGPDPSRSHDGREAYGRLLAALRELPRRQREAFTLRVLEEFDVADTARIMKCSEGSVKTHLSRARAALQRQLEDFA